MAPNRNGPSVAERLRQTRRLLRSEGSAGVLGRLRTRAAERLAGPAPEEIPVLPADLALASEKLAAGIAPPGPKPWRQGEPLDVALVCGPAGEGSGGHTTIFRMLAGLERRGHRCTVYIYDRHGWEIDQHRRGVRQWWPWLEAEVKDLADGIEDAHVLFATSWETAYPVLASPAEGAPLLLRPGLRAALLPRRGARPAGRGDLPLRLPRGDRGPLAGRGAAA